MNKKFWMRNIYISLFLILLNFHLNAQDNTDLDFELIVAAEEGDSAKVMALLNKGADVNATTAYDGITPLMYACDSGHYMVAKILLVNGAEVDAIPYNSLSAFHSAAIKGNWQIGELLIQHGANINIKDNEGFTPLHYACYNGHFNFAEMLLFYGANINITDNNRRNALYYAIMMNDLDIAELLITNGIDVNNRDESGNTPLMAAAAQNDTAMVNILLKSNADINLTNNNGMDALSFAIMSGSKGVCKLLLENEAKIEVDKEINRNLLYYAKDKELKSYLKAEGIKPSYWPFFNKVEPLLNTTFNTDDVLLGFGIGLHEAKYKLTISGGYSFRPWVRSVLIKRFDDEYYQYWEKRSCIWLGLNKDIKIITGKKRNLGFTLGIKNILTSAKYEGSGIAPSPFYLISPGIGIFSRREYTALYLKYEYADFQLYDFSKNWISLSFALRLNMDNRVKSMNNLLNY